jgi:hypothetical protein
MGDEVSELTGDSGWRPVRRPNADGRPAEPLRDLIITPFMRLSRVHALLAASDGMIAVALAGSIFFSIDPAAARWRVALYLLLTIAPFAIVTPLIGPVIDRARSGRRGMIIATGAGRAVLAMLMVRHIDSILLFPEAFGMLVLQKSYSVAKSAVVPKLVRSRDELVDANARLALLSAIAGMGGVVVGGAFTIGGPDWVAGVAVLGYVAAVVAAFQLPAVTVADSPPDAEERAELRSRGILLAASAMGVLRGVVGFLTFLLAFSFRGGEDGVDIRGRGGAAGGATAVIRDVDIAGRPNAPAWHFGAVLLAAGVGALVGARVAPVLRRRIAEERILQGSLAVTSTAALLGAWLAGLPGAFVAALAVAVSAASAKLAFDAIVQRDAPEANHGRSFARFEARFQLLWAAGALFAVLPLAMPVGLAAIGVVTLLAVASYTLGLHGYETPLERVAITQEIRRRLPSLPAVSGRSFLRRRAGGAVVEPPDGPTPAEDPATLDATWVHDGPEPVDATWVHDGPEPVDATWVHDEPEPVDATWLEDGAVLDPTWTEVSGEPGEGDAFRPWVSSGEGVEVDPAPPRRTPPDRPGG